MNDIATTAAEALLALDARPSGRPTLGPPLARVLITLGILAMAIAARWVATVEGRSDALLVGALFGTALLAGARLGGPGVSRLSSRSLASSVLLGLAAGAALVAIAVLVRWPGPWVPLRPAATFAPWALVTITVAAGEEALIRGALFDAVDEAAGATIAVVTCALVFALMHVPLYGWLVVPLDLGVGLVLGGLRLVSGGTLAPVVAHAVADLATWWL
ncbi:MAG TPA: CPBP family intramembrane glutamic endopeptidase [Candidatus Dormibacteraeota bacterium]|nr:CPBP family intramembrane glutamic endopeptidase [Candidatus Dormibacteraeota bacterium]